MFLNGESYDDIADRLGVSVPTIKGKVYRLKLHRSGDPNSSWTDERVKALKRLWKEGVSATDVASMLGGVSRNAVIGKVHRLGLQRRKQTFVKKIYPKKITKIKSANKKREREYEAPPSPVEPKHIDLMELSNSTCRYPHTKDGRTTYCGHQTAEGSSYCKHHKSVCSRKPKSREQAA
jgi:GcrA cell cycle regulator